jgi:hypothetical protein
MKLTKNGRERVLDGVDPAAPLLWAIRPRAGKNGNLAARTGSDAQVAAAGLRRSTA